MAPTEATGDNPEPLSVASACALLSRSLAPLRELCVRGECESVSTRAAGSFFDLRGDGAGAVACLSCVAWASSGVRPREGRVLQVRVSHFSLFAPRGALQAVVSSARPVATEGARAAMHAHLLGALVLEGVLRRPRLVVPDVPTHLCIVTSIGSAAFEDIMHGVRARWPGLRVTAIDSLVQGPRSAGQLAAALGQASRLSPAPDVIVVARGGGAAGKLDAFSNEQLVRALVVPGIPVISAVGHETDRCISDEVADLRAKTPTAAVELALPASLAERQRELAQLRRAGAEAAARLLARCARPSGPDALALLAAGAGAAARGALAAARQALRARAGEARALVERRARNCRASLAQQQREARAAAQRALHRAPAKLRAAAQRVAATCLRRRRVELEPHRALARGAAGAALHAAQATLGELAGRAAALSHACTLKQGYCVLRLGDDGPVVTSARDLPDGARLTATLADSTLELVLKRARCG